MSVSLNHLSIAVHNSFYPLSNTPATSLVDQLPPGHRADCLLLSGCDVRKILYTLYSEQDNGFARVYDFTCCEEEPAVLARGILLLSVLLDNPDQDVYSKLWNLFHDFRIDSATFVLIRDQSAKLVLLSSTLATWAQGPYGNTLRIANSETLQKLHDIWTAYTNAINSQDSVEDHFKKATKTIVRNHYSPNDDEHEIVSPLTRSFGIMAMGSNNVASHHMQQFWTTGVSDSQDIPTNPICNPLFVYTSVARDKFIVNYSTTPLAIFHLASVVPKFETGTLFGQPARARAEQKVERNTRKTVCEAKLQFNNWCKAFQQFVNASNDSRISIRFAVADPLALCHALQQRTCSSHFETLTNPSSPWSGKNLILDGDDFTTTAVTPCPLTFNVVETSCLVDRIGVINILVATVPLLQSSPASSIKTESTIRPWSEETSLLRQLLCGDTTFMCNLFGVAPIPYLTEVSTRGLVQDLPTLFDFSGDRPAPGSSCILWKIPALGDPVAVEPMHLSIDPNNLSKILIAIYIEMFADEAYFMRIGNRKTVIDKYTKGNFAALLAFIRSRVCVDWELAIAEFTRTLRPHDDLDELRAALYLFGVSATVTPILDAVDIPPSVRDHLSAKPHAHAILSLPTPSTITCVVFSVPRRCLQPIYEKCFEKTTEVDCIFEVRVRSPRSTAVYSSFLPIFGKLVTDADGQPRHIDVDENGWFGVSDLHVCLSLATRTLFLENIPGQLEISLNLSSNRTTRSVFRADYGPGLEIFKAKVFDETHVQMVKSIPGHPVPTPSIIPGPTNGVTSSDATVSFSQPELGVKNGNATFTMRITLLTSAGRQALISGSEVTAKHTSPCGITISCASTNHVCPFPYPVNGRECTVRIARKSSWIEVCTPLAVPGTHDGGYTHAFLPLTRQNGTDVLCTWSLPTINFNRLPRIDFDDKDTLAWLGRHLTHAFSDCECLELGLPNMRLSTTFKISLCAFFRHLTGLGGDKGQVLGISVNHVLQILFFVTGVYMDPASHNVVAEAYCFQVTPEHRAIRATLPEAKKFDVKTIEVSLEELQLWQKSLPSMAERCRDWEHKENCEYSKGIPVHGGVCLCSCGRGVVKEEFLEVKQWEEFVPDVFRIAVSPLFPAPFVEQTREQSLVAYDGALGKVKDDISETKACIACGGVGKTKKCARCEKVFYCGKDCQKKHWKWHKKECRRDRSTPVRIG